MNIDGLFREWEANCKTNREAGLKHCATCGQWKNRDKDFSYNLKAKGNRQPYCKECDSYRAREWEINNLDRRRKTKIEYKYKIAKQEWNNIFERQGRTCAICKSLDSNCEADWQTDHCHKTGKIRGILCKHCNHILHKHVTPEILRAAADYLANSESNH